MNLNIIKALALLPLSAHAIGASAQDGRAVRARWVMGTLCEIQAPGAPEGAIDAAFGELERWDRILSRHKDDSELSALNRSAGAGPFYVSAGLYAAAELALSRAEETGGAYDPTVLPLLLGGGPAALPKVGWSKVKLDAAASTVELPAGMGLDFGGIGKGLALDRAGEILKARGVSAALFNFGGQILAIGAPAGAEGWSVTLPGRFEPLIVKDASVAVSGDTERPGHIVSPFTGLPVRRPLAVAVLAPTASLADGWSTALYVLGKNPPSFRGRSFFIPGIPRSKKGDRT